ncbi:MAG: histidinol-phosphatase [Chloroflexota bacterium]|nr:histidinol-phosphatase [Chloroflexota bacterium]
MSDRAQAHDTPAALLAFAHRLVDETDPLAMDYFAGELTITAKHDRSLVTQADTGIETLLRERITASFPDHGVLGEEFGSEAAGAETRWVIDPIDGTHNFVRGIAVWATLIAVEQAGELVAAVVSAPALGQRWAAVRGGGAMTRFAGAERGVHVSTVDQLSRAQLLFSTLRSLEAKGYGEALRRLVGGAWRDRGFGDFWGYMLVAQGSAEAMIEVGPTVWDLAAPALILAEAGGLMTDFAGNASYAGPTALATNALLHDLVVAELAEDGAPRS